jgi:hypothetical protein
VPSTMVRTTSQSLPLKKEEDGHAGFVEGVMGSSWPFHQVRFVLTSSQQGLMLT